jgi:hypothetical protein
MRTAIFMMSALVAAASAAAQSPAENAEGALGE